MIRRRCGTSPIPWRWLAGIAFAVVASAAAAQAQKPPPKLEPLPEPPPPPPGVVDPGLEPQVTITTREGDTVEEFRVGGRVVMIKVTPRGGVAYYLIDEAGDGRMIRREPHDLNLRVPLWLLFSF